MPYSPNCCAVSCKKRVCRVYSLRLVVYLLPLPSSTSCGIPVRSLMALLIYWQWNLLIREKIQKNPQKPSKMLRNKNADGKLFITDFTFLFISFHSANGIRTARFSDLFFVVEWVPLCTLRQWHYEQELTRRDKWMPLCGRKTLDYPSVKCMHLFAHLLDAISIMLCSALSPFFIHVKHH